MDMVKNNYFYELLDNFWFGCYEDFGDSKNGMMSLVVGLGDLEYDFLVGDLREYF